MKLIFGGNCDAYNSQSTDSINQSDIDDITDGICSLLTNAAVRLDMYQSQTCMRENKGQKNKIKSK